MGCVLVVIFGEYILIEDFSPKMLRKNGNRDLIKQKHTNNGCCFCRPSKKIIIMWSVSS